MTTNYLKLARFYGRHSFWQFEVERFNNHLFNDIIFAI